MEKAIVVAKWIGSVPARHSSGMVCYRVETAVTDANGGFVIPYWHHAIDPKGDISWLPYVSPLHVETFVFETGFEAHEVRTRDRKPMNLRLQRMSTHQRSMDTLRQLNYKSACDAGPRANRIPLARALVAEAMAIESRGALTKEDRWALDALLYGADALEFGVNEGRRRQKERLAKEEQQQTDKPDQVPPAPSGGSLGVRKQ